MRKDQNRMGEMRKLETEKRRDDMKKVFVRHIHE